MKFRKTIYFFVIAYVLCFLQCYLSMHAYAKELSAICLNCIFYTEILMTSLLIIFIFPVAWLLNMFKLSIKIRYVISSISFFMLSYLVNISIFDSRVASWSSYSHKDVLISVFFLAYPYLSVSVLLFWLATKKLNLLQLYAK